MDDEYDDLDLGLQDLKWPTPPEDPPSSQPTAGATVPTPRDPVPDLLEQQIQQARVNGTTVPVGVVQQHALVTPAVQPVAQPVAPQVESPPAPLEVFVRPIDRRLFVVLQTVPDYDRVAKMPLPPLPAMEETCSFEDLPEPVGLVKSKTRYQTILELIKEKNPPRDWLEAVVWNEEQIPDGRKRRRAVIEECDRRIQMHDTVHAALTDRILTLSAVPEFSQIVGIAFACGDGPVHSLAVGQPMRNQTTIHERAILSLLWTSLQAVSKLVCWGDCRSLLYTRSCLVGIEPRTIRPIDLEDLSQYVVGSRSLGPATLEDVCLTYGIDTPIDPLPSQLLVADAWSRENFSEVQASSSVRLEMLRRLWQKWEGFHVARNT